MSMPHVKIDLICNARSPEDIKDSCSSQGKGQGGVEMRPCKEVRLCDMRRSGHGMLLRLQCPLQGFCGLRAGGILAISLRDLRAVKDEERG